MKTDERIKQTGEVFTPPKLVEEILDKLPQECWEDGKTWLDPTCGDGNFLVAVKDRLLALGRPLNEVLSVIYGVDIMQDNVDDCKARLDPDNLYPEIVNKNIICADGLKYHYRFDDSFPYDAEAVWNSSDLWED